MITKEYLHQELAKRIDGYKRGVATTTDNIIAEMKSILVLVDALNDYEKKYNEALERAKAYHRNELAGTRQEMTEYIFPELRESEDERIRKAIIKSIEEDSSVYEQEVSKEQMLSYLKKQKEQKHYWKPTETDVALFNKVVITNNALTPAERAQLDIIRSKFGYCRAANCSGIVQEEQEPAKEIKDQRQIYFMIEDGRRYGRRCGVIEGRKQVIDNPEEYGLQKQAEWSEEDEKMIGTIVSVLGQYIDYKAVSGTGTGYATPRYSKEIDWLKSLRSQSHWKKSLATADLENSLCDLQDNYHDGSYEYKVLGEAIEFIRCTEPSPSWKPSEEQMEGLKFFLEFHRSQRNVGTVNWREYDAIESLYEDLKKL